MTTKASYFFLAYIVTYLGHCFSLEARVTCAFKVTVMYLSCCRYKGGEFEQEGKNRTFEHLCEHIENLSSVNKQCQITVKDSQQSLKEKSYFSVFSDILKKLSHIAEY